jgi:hypothetical protein
VITIVISKATRGTDIQISGDDLVTLRKMYKAILGASLRVDKCAKLLWHGNVASGEYSFLLTVPGLPYEVACTRMASQFPTLEHSYPQTLIGG